MGPSLRWDDVFDQHTLLLLSSQRKLGPIVAKRTNLT